MIRDIKKVDAEYDKDKYARLLEFYGKGHHTFEEINREYMPFEHRVVSVGCREYFVSTIDYEKIERDILIGSLAGCNVDTVVELGCGYGSNFNILNNVYRDKTWIGGECSANAIKLGNLLFSGYDNISIVPFNWYDDEWSIFEGLGRVVVLTKFTIEQLPEVKKVMRNFLKYRDRIESVVHIEPVFELNDGSPLGRARRAYTIENDYNTDLLSSLYSIGASITRMEYDVVGYNPLNPTSVICWDFQE